MRLTLLGISFATPTDLYMHSSVIKFQYKYFNSLRLFIGTGQESKKESIDMEISLGRSNTLIGNNSDVKWGVDCSKDSSNNLTSCQLTDQSPSRIQFIYNRQISTVNAEMYLRLEEGNKLSENDQKNTPKMKFDLVTQQQYNTWQFDKWGVLGLAPNGQFFTYLNQLYSSSEKVQLALKHNLPEKDADNDNLRFKIQPYVNPKEEKHYNQNDIVGTYDIPKEDNYWSIYGDVSLDGTPFNYKQQKICLNTMVNELFGVIDSLVWCDQVKKMVCDGDTKHCTKSKADLTLAPTVTMKFGDNTLKFTHEDYIFFVDDDLNCRIGDICDPRSEETCADDTEVVLGKLFFVKYTPILNLDIASGATSVTLVSYFKAPKESVLVWLIIAIVAAIIAAATLVYIVVKQKKEDADGDGEESKNDVYHTIQNDEGDEENINEEKN